MRREEESISWEEKGGEYYLVLWAGRVACKTESIEGRGYRLYASTSNVLPTPVMWIRICRDVIAGGDETLL